DVFGLAASAEVEHGHADGDAVGHLLEDNAAGGVGDVAVDLDTAVDWARVHDDSVRLHPAGTGVVEAEHAGVFADGREMADALALVLDAEEHDDVGVGEGGAEVVRDLDAHRLEPVRHEGGGAHDGDVGAELGEGVDVGAGDAAEKDVAEDNDL